MTLFVAVVASNLVQIVCRSVQIIPVLIIVFFLIGLTRLGYVDSSGRDKAYLLLLVLLLSSMAVFLLLPSLSGRLWVTGAGTCFRGQGLRFFLLEIFSWLALGTDLSCGRIGWPGALRTVLIHVFSGGPRLYICFGLGGNCFFPYLDEKF